MKLNGFTTVGIVVGVADMPELLAKPLSETINEGGTVAVILVKGMTVASDTGFKMNGS